MVERGFVHQVTDLEGLDRFAAGDRVVAYVGFDCTADSLHVGHLVSIMLLRWLQRTGHRPIALIGGGTTKVGDPSGKDESRQLLDEATIARNIRGIRRSLESFLEFGERPDQALVVNNAEWLDELRYIEFLRGYGRHFTVNRMLTFESVKQRLEREQPLTFLEFNYMIMQAYDFLELARRYGCQLQMGGSDQWGNIVNGVELGRRVDGARAVRADHAADHHGERRQDGQDRPGRRLAERGPAVELRLLAVLAQRRRRRRRPVPAPVHRAAARRDRAARGARRRGAQRRQEDPGRRGDQAVPGRGGGARSAAGREEIFEQGKPVGTRDGLGSKATERGGCIRSTSTAANSERA